MRILFVITQGHSGGAQKYVLDLFERFKNTHEVFLAIGQDEADTFAASYPHIPLLRLKHLKRDISPIEDILALLELHSLYTSLKPDIVHLNSSKAGVIGSLARTKAPKIIYTAHGWVFLEPLSPIKKFIYKSLEYLSSRFRDATIVLSPEEHAVARTQLHIPESKLHIIPVGIAPIPFLEKDASRKYLTTIEPKLDKNLFWTGTIANHYKTKGLDIFIEAIATLDSATRQKFQSIIIGDGPERQDLKAKIQKYQLEDTLFLLPSTKNAAQYLKAFDFFILPSRKEGLPYTLLEALQAQIPIIATNVGGIPSLIKSPDKGSLIPAQDPLALAAALRNALSHTSTAKTKEENQDNSLLTMIQSTETLYLKLRALETDP